ncbi:hypothetical protein J7I91_13170 [Pseudomonas sp. ISL-84]|nr:hypothetical protein [Pseudomonas sp. ISL-84]
MKEENDEFINRVSQLKINALTEKAESKEKNVKAQKMIETNDKPNRLARASALQAVKAYKKNSDQADKQIELKGESVSGFDSKASAAKVEKQSDSEAQQHHASSLLDNVLILKKQGLAEDEIAKILGKGRTEIALMLKFRQNQQE